MMSDYCVDIIIPVPHPLRNPSILNQDGHKSEIWFPDTSEVSDEFKNWLDSLGLVMTYPPLIFYTPPHRECGAHIDGSGITDRAVMNWIVKGTNSIMHWYKLSPEAEITKGEITQAGTPYTRYTEEDIVHIHSQEVKWPSLVQTGIPHKITNYGNEPRWCLSCDISFKDKPNDGMTMAQAIETFKKWI